MPKVERMLVASGGWFTIECAVRADLSCPVGVFLAQMSRGALEDDMNEPMEPDEQVDWHKWFIGACRVLADTGEPVHNHSYNQLHDGIWEFKHASLRVTFYDTDGTGFHEPKIDRSPLGYYARRPWPEDFDERLRLTTVFEKCGQKATTAQLQLADEVRWEDLEHDGPEDESGGAVF